MKITDLQCQIKIPFCICDRCFFWEWKLQFSYLKTLVLNFTQTLETGRKIKPSSFPLIIGKGQLWYEQIWLMLEKSFSHVLNLKVHRLSTGHMMTRKHKNVGEASSSLSDWLAWCFGNCWIARTFIENLSYRSAVIFLSIFIATYFSRMEFWHSHFLNRIQFVILLFRLVQHQVHAFFFSFPFKTNRKPQVKNWLNQNKKNQFFWKQKC